MRRATINRETKETRIALRLALDGKGRYDVHSGIRFLDHMLELFARHGASICSSTRAEISTSTSTTPSKTSASRSVKRLSTALGNRRGINRAGYFVMPMDETLAVAAIDLADAFIPSSICG